MQPDLIISPFLSDPRVQGYVIGVRSNHQSCSMKAVFKKLAKSIGKHLLESLFDKVAGLGQQLYLKQTPVKVFSC